ncbi:D-alanyl-D-alanine carboxypeptidase [Streptomyces sp. NPDC059618]|uniref:D-alanyl-D-alanine carboxypeptidase n=1 Tax=Streptomyces sp. NPDC059618 TaxID=3346887 RepID=UPI0036B41B7F
MAMARERAATVRVDQATAVFSTKALKGEAARTADAPLTAEPERASESADGDGASGGKNAEGDTRLRAAVAAWVAGSDEPEPSDSAGSDAGTGSGADAGSEGGTGAGGGDDAGSDDSADDSAVEGSADGGADDSVDGVEPAVAAADEPGEGTGASGASTASEGTSGASGEPEGPEASGVTSGTDEKATEPAAEPAAGADSDADSDRDIDIDADADAGSDSDADAGSDVDADADPDKDSASRSGREPEAAAETPADDEGDEDEPASASATEDEPQDAAPDDEPEASPAAGTADAVSDEPADAEPSDAEPSDAEPADAEPSDAVDGETSDTEADEDSAPERPVVDQPTAVFKTPRRPAVDQPTTMLKLGGATRKPAGRPEGEPEDEPEGKSAGTPVRTSKFVPLNRLDDFPPARTKPAPEPAAKPEPARKPEPAAKPEPGAAAASAAPAAKPAPAEPKRPAAPEPASKPKPSWGVAPASAPSAPKAFDKPAAATAAIPQVGPERTTQLPLPPKPPLDLLAELTNTPPPPQTPVRTLVRRVKIWTPLVLLVLVIFAVAQAFRPLPAASLALSADSTYTFGGGTLDLPWPGQGQSAIEVDGVGSLGTDGKQAPAPTASVAKIMTAYVILQEHPLKGNEEGEKITVDQQAEDESKLPDESTAAMSKGQQFTERQMLQMLMIPSGNNVARLLARWDSDAKTFVAKMNTAAKDLGMTNTTYTDPSGLQKTTVSTATDQVKLAKQVMKNDVFRSVVGMAKADIPGLPGTIYNNNDLLVKQVGVIGLKTGSSTPAGGNLVWAATKVVDGRTQTVYGAVMNQNAGTGKVWDSLQLAITNSQKLIDKVQKSLVTATVVKKGQVVGYVDDQLGGRTPVVATKNMTAIGWPGLKTRLSIGQGKSAVPHTGKAGTVVGELRVGDGSSEAVRIPVALQSDLAEPGFGAKLTRVG